MSLFKQAMGVSFGKMFFIVMLIVNLFVGFLHLVGQSDEKVMQFFLAFNLLMPMFLGMIGFLFWVGGMKR